jgi:glycosyltransferase involved in cell wall biosynthesis
MMRVLIYEPQFLGHNLGHVALLLDELAKLPCEVTVATSRQAVESAEFAVQLGERCRHTQLDVLKGFQLDKHRRRVRTGGLTGSATIYRGLCRAMDDARPDHLFVPYGNTLARIACLPAGLSRRLRRDGAEAETLLVGGRFMLRENQWAARFRQTISYQMLAHSPWTTVFHLDSAAVEALHAGNFKLRQTVKLMPEPVKVPTPKSKLAARQNLNIPADGRYVAVIGLIEERKGIGWLIDALGRLPADCRLLLAGKCDPPTRVLLTEQHGELLRSGRVIALDRYLTQDEFDSAIFAADVVAAVYPQHLHSSSIVAAAAAARRPVVGAAVGWIGRTIDDFQLGVTCVPQVTGALASALREGLRMASHFQLSPAGQRFVQFNTAANFGATWTAQLRRRLGVPQSPALVERNAVPRQHRMAA